MILSLSAKITEFPSPEVKPSSRHGVEMWRPYCCGWAGHEKHQRIGEAEALRDRSIIEHHEIGLSADVDCWAPARKTHKARMFLSPVLRSAGFSGRWSTDKRTAEPS